MYKLQVLVPMYMKKRNDQVKKHLSLLSEELNKFKTNSIVADFCWDVVESLFSRDAIPVFTLHSDTWSYTNLIGALAQIVNSNFTKWYKIEDDTLKTISAMLCSMDIKESNYFLWMTTSLTNILKLHFRVKGGLINLDDLERINSQLDSLNKFLRAVIPRTEVKDLLFNKEDINRKIMDFEKICHEIQNILFKEVHSMDSQHL